MRSEVMLTLKIERQVVFFARLVQMGKAISTIFHSREITAHEIETGVENGMLVLTTGQKTSLHATQAVVG